MSGCDYCGRAWGNAFTCDGCGVPIPPNRHLPAFIVDKSVTDDRVWQFRPGVNIPIDLTALPANACLADYYLDTITPTVRGYYK